MSDFFLNNSFLSLILSYCDNVTIFCFMFTSKEINSRIINLFKKHYIPIPKTDDLCGWAAEMGYFGPLICLYEFHFPIHHYSFHISNCIAKSGNLKMLQWVHARGCNFNENIFTNAVESGNIEMLNWLVSIESKIVLDSFKKANMEVLEWAHEKKYSIHYACISAAKNGDIKLLKWLESIHMLHIDGIYHGAVQRGRLEVLQWVYDLQMHSQWNYASRAHSLFNLSDNKNLCSIAAKNGQLDALMWLCDHGCGYTSSTCACAAESGSLEILKYLRKEDVYGILILLWKR